jgi:arginyl-tRNA synthetase
LVVDRWSFVETTTNDQRPTTNEFMNILPALKTRFQKALAGLLDDSAEIEKSLDLIRRSQDPKFGDYQANMAMSLGKKLGQKPRDVAAAIVERLDVADLCETPEIAGPGFINLRVKDDWLAGRLAAAVGDKRLGVPAVEKPRTYIVDYSAPNVAKPMHVGHIRSTVIGDALCRTLKFLGHRAVSDNHIGDWGTQFGMILYGYKNFLDKEAYQKNPVEELARLYKLVRQIIDYQEKNAGGEGGAADLAKLSSQHPNINAAVLNETAKLHAGDAENRRLWAEFLPACEDEISRVYGRLNVTFDHTLGESFYEDRLAAEVEELLQKGLARESDGAICVFFKDAKGEEEKVPMIVRKQDGAFLYATTDLATIRYRVETWSPDAILYVVDHRQGMHFKHLFAAARMLGHENLELEHVSFGTVLGDDGKPFKTRSGDTVGLESLLDEAVRRAGEIVSANDDAKPDGPELSPERRAEIAEIVGIGALKYADLSQNRTSDYVFSYDKMLAMNGNTATYMQYAYARVRSIFAKGNVDVDSLRDSGAKILLTHPAERALAMEILRLSEALELTVFDYRPNQLTSYLFELANRYFTFYENCHVLNAETDELRQSRLLLCDLTARTIRKGLELLGIRVVEKM